MKRISRYLIAEFGPPFFLSFAFILFLLSLGALFQVVDLLVKNLVSGVILFRYFFLLLFSLMPYGLVLAVLIGSTLTFSRFSQDREFLAIKSLGISLTNAVRPLLFLGLLLSLVNLCLLCCVQPYALYQNRIVFSGVRVNPTANLVRPGSVVTEFPNIVLFIPSKGKKGMVTLYQKEGETVRTISAHRVKLVFRSGKPYLYLQDGVLQTYESRKAKTYQRLSFQTYIFPLPEIAGSRERPEPKIYERSSFQLWRSGTAGARAEQMRRFSFALAPLLFLLVGIPLGIALPRSLWGITASCGLVLSYYFALTGIEALMRVKPQLAGLYFLPDAVILLTGIYFFKRIE
ncbi:MAG: LptF/LptG family permease [Candidatus Omnitrophota bacterium]